MSDIALSVRNLTKEYRILHNAERHNRVTDAVADSVKGMFRKKEVETFKALDDVSFDVKKGEVLGIIGRNGAGKSTLLKVLSRITEPTSGEIHLYGRVGSLLEVGTGFHPELTGQENIYLNGAILGMKKREIDRQFDAIVDFAEVEKFLDTPVKRYSSGMYVRLAFAVAAHLNPEILIVDEVLAVGDAQFQKKCLGKMQDVSRQEGRTVLFVSHNMAAVKALCTDGLYLSKGSLVAIGASDTIVSRYLRNSRTDNAIAETVEGRGVNITSIGIKNTQSNDFTRLLTAYRNYLLECHLEFQHPQHRIAIQVEVYSDEGVVISRIAPVEEGIGWVSVKHNATLKIEIPSLQLMPGTYWVNVVVHGMDALQLFEHVLSFEVEPTVLANSSVSYRPYHGIYRIAGRYQIEIDNAPSYVSTQSPVPVF